MAIDDKDKSVFRNFAEYNINRFSYQNNLTSNGGDVYYEFSIGNFGYSNSYLYLVSDDISGKYTLLGYDKVPILIVSKWYREDPSLGVSRLLSIF